MSNCDCEVKPSNHAHVANAGKHNGKILFYKGIPIIQRPEVPKDTMYLINLAYFETIRPRRKDGKPDMRYRINKLHNLLHMI